MVHHGFFLLIAWITFAAANSITFWALDNLDRTVYFTANENQYAIEPVKVKGSSKKHVHLPHDFTGNFYAVIEGQEDKPGMLGEVKFSGGFGLTYFDVSAIVDPNDHDNIKQMWPALSREPISGCETFPCANAYYLPDDIQTKSTAETDLVTTLGGSSAGSSALWS